MKKITSRRYFSEFYRRPNFILAFLALIILLSRLPFLQVDYGMDPDSYRVINASEEMLKTGKYRISRSLGYPIHEIVTTLLLPLSSIATNGMSAIFSVIAFVFFALILRRLGIRNYLLVAMAFVFTPVVYINSVSTIDYLWALGFILGGFYFVIHNRPALAGLHLGLAIGCRITSGLMILPYFLYLWFMGKESDKVKNTLMLTLISLPLGALFYILPLFQGYSLDEFRAQVELFLGVHTVYGVVSVVGKATTGIYGAWGSSLLGALALLLLFQWKKVGQQLDKSPRGVVWISLAVILIYFVLYMLHPNESEYLLPMIPFVFLLLALGTPPVIFRVFCLLMLLSSFLITIDQNGISFYGPIWTNHLYRKEASNMVKTSIRAVDELPHKSIIVSGLWLVRIYPMLDSSSRQGVHRHVYLIKDEAQYRSLVKEGYSIYFLPGQAFYNRRACRIDIESLGAAPLISPPERPWVISSEKIPLFKKIHKVYLNQYL